MQQRINPNQRIADTTFKQVITVLSWIFFVGCLLFICIGLVVFLVIGGSLVTIDQIIHNLLYH
jgi:hypothetical protein